MELLRKLHTFMVGAGYDDEDYVEDEMYEDEYIDDEPSYRYEGREGSYRPSRQERNRPSLASFQREPMGKRPSEMSNVLTMPRAVSLDVNNLFICKPRTIEEAASVCKQFKSSSICVVTLEGLPQVEAQRIADLLSGACFVLDGIIERITTNVFVMAPSGIGVSSELREHLKKGESLFSWMMPSGRN